MFKKFRLYFVLIIKCLKLVMSFTSSFWKAQIPFIIVIAFFSHKWDVWINHLVMQGSNRLAEVMVLRLFNRKVKIRHNLVIFPSTLIFCNMTYFSLFNLKIIVCAHVLKVVGCMCRGQRTTFMRSVLSLHSCVTWTQGEARWSQCWHLGGGSQKHIFLPIKIETNITYLPTHYKCMCVLMYIHNLSF